MAVSLTPRHLPRYRDIASLLIKHARADGLRPSDDREASEADAQKLVDDLEAMGPTFVKLGQLLSTRADLLPPVYLEALARLQDDVEPFGFAEVEDIVSSELGARMSKAFQSFHHVPLASASLGQVHAAVLRDGRHVAVKVQRPGVRDRVIEDMDVIEELAEFLDDHTNVGRRYGFAAMVKEFRASLMAELDYRLEAANLRLLGANLESYDRIVVPQPIDDYTTSLVLTMDLVDGRNVGSLGPLAQLELDGRPLAEQLFRAYLDQILVHGFVHADPHPGNVLLTSDGRLALIDLGMVARVDAALQDSLVRLLLAVSEGDGVEAARVMAGLGEPREDYDSQRFEHSVVELIQRNQQIVVGELEAGRVVGDLARIAGECGLRPPAELTMLAKALLNLDQVAAKLDPGFDPNAAIRDHVASVMRAKMLQSASPGNILAAAMDAKEFAEKLPGRVNKVMDALAEGTMTLNVQGIDEAELMRGIQKLANRLTTGVVVAALIIGAAMIMRVETDARLFGYPTLAIILFLVASLAGLWLVVTSLVNDLPQRRRRGRRSG
ncbi:MAG: ubiquinone biosynthesis protein [Acidimicrobiaceae bacterium]|jgi:predicted unusual protein kinase regulating ubiquinone biosynthesis (AarF/ABC1/UbiB family)